MADQRLDERIRDTSRRWYFTKEELLNYSPSRAHGIDPDKELSYRQQAANMIQDMGQRLSVYVTSVLLRRCIALCPLGARSGGSLGTQVSANAFLKEQTVLFTSSLTLQCCVPYKAEICHFSCFHCLLCGRKKL